MGDLLSEARERAFHNVKAVLRISAKERVWERRACGLSEEREGMVVVWWFTSAWDLWGYCGRGRMESLVLELGILQSSAWYVEILKRHS